MNVASVRDVEKQLADETVENFSVLRFRPNVISANPFPLYPFCLLLTIHSHWLATLRRGELEVLPPQPGRGVHGL